MTDAELDRMEQECQQAKDAGLAAIREAAPKTGSELSILESSATYWPNRMFALIDEVRKLRGLVEGLQWNPCEGTCQKCGCYNGGIDEHGESHPEPHAAGCPIAEALGKK